MMSEGMMEIVIRSLKMPEEGAVMLPSSGEKDAALERLGIERQEGETHLQAYLRAMADENGLPVQKPAHPLIAQSIYEDRNASLFVWYLA